MLFLKAVFRKTKSAQALLEFAIWGSLMIMVSSIIVSYVMYLVCRQDLMIRNFRSAVKFAADKGRTGGMVYQVMVEHKKIPTIGPSFMSGYREIQDVIGVIWSWNILWKESDKDPDQTGAIARYMVNGENVSGLIPKNSNSDSMLPDPLKGRQDFLVISNPPEEYIFSKKDSILNSIKYLQNDSPDTYNLIENLFEQLDNKSYMEMSDEERSDYLSQLQEGINELNSLGESDASSGLSDIYDYLANEKWRGDVDSVGDLLGKKTLVQDQRVETIQVGPNQKRVDITGSYTVTHESNTTSGNVEITWQAENESIVGN